MSHKLMLSTLTALCMSASLFALDEYMPVPARVMQINVGFDRTSIAGRYQDSWESDEMANPNNPMGVPIQGKFGLLDKLEGSMAIRYMAVDSAGHTGLDRPVLALKYGDSATGGGGFLAITLPVGFQDIMNSGNYATMTFGAMYGKNFSHINLLANASYSFNTEDDNKTKIDNFRLFVKPEYPLPLKWIADHKQYLGVSLSATYDVFFNAMVNGESINQGAQLFQVAPGLNYRFNALVGGEINFPIAIAGQNQADFQTVKAQLNFTLDEALYNSL